MENNLENRSKFFNLYHRQNVNSSKGKCCLRDADFIDSLEWIELKHISLITLDLVTTIGIDNHYGKSISLYDSVEDYLMVMEDEPDFWTQFETDLLRSNSFAVPYNSLSVEKLIEYGWIKLKNSNP